MALQSSEPTRESPKLLSALVSLPHNHSTLTLVVLFGRLLMLSVILLDHKFRMNLTWAGLIKRLSLTIVD